MSDRPESNPPTTDPGPAAADGQRTPSGSEQSLESPVTPSSEHPDPDQPAAPTIPGGLRPTLRLLIAAGHSLAELNAAGRALQQRRAQAAIPPNPAPADLPDASSGDH